MYWDEDKVRSAGKLAERGRNDRATCIRMHVVTKLVYMSDFGELTVVPNYVQTTANAASVFILNPETLGVAYLQPFQATPLAKTGHTEKEMVFVECTLVVESEKANGQIKDLTA